ncbi:MAG: YlqD family protein [Sporomusaceae bacterium]|jgi:hypothetical protein|nr:YlqD family protein [Sporomusaceae bacterium]
MSAVESVIVKCPITIKAKVTEDLKAKLAAEISEKIKKTDLDLQQIDLQAKRMMSEQAKVDAHGLHGLWQQIEAERQKRNEYKNMMVEKLRETANLEIGSEIAQGSLDRLVTIMVGSDIQKIMSTEILVEDGKVIAFRN